MYLIYEQKSGILQIGFSSLTSIGVLKGIFLQDSVKASFYKNGVFFVYVKYFSFFHFDSDLRLQFFNLVLRQCLLFFFKIFFYTSLRVANLSALLTPYLRWGKTYFSGEITLKLFRISYILFTIFCILHILSGGIFRQGKENKNTSPQKKEYIDLDKWKKIFKETRLANKISNKKFTYIAGEIPILEGIWRFQILPLSDLNLKNSDYGGILAVPFKNIIKLKTDKSILRAEPFLICGQSQSKNADEIYYAYKINNNDDMILFKSEEKDEKVMYPRYFIFPQLEQEIRCDFFSQSQKSDIL